MSFKHIKKLFKYLDGCKRFVVGYIIVALIEAILGVVIPIFSAKRLVYLTDSLMNQLLLASIIVALLNLIQIISNCFKSLFYKRINLCSTINIQNELARQILLVETSEVDKVSSGLFIERLANDTSEISNVFMEMSYWTSYFLSNIGVLVALFILNKYFFIFGLIEAICSFFVTRQRVEKQTIFNKGIKAKKEVKSGLITEVIHGIRDIKVLNAANSILDEIKHKITDVADEERKYQKVYISYSALESVIKELFDFIFIILGIYLFKNELVTIPILIIAYNYQPRVKRTLLAVAELLDYGKRFGVAFDRVFEIIDGDKFKKETFGSVHVNKLEGNIEFRNVSFGYEKNKKVIDKMNFKVKPNEKVAFVGQSGAGKSTIFGLISKLYNINSGDILFDGISINDLDCDSLRNNMSIITQDPYIFNFSIKENLLIAKKNATMKEIREACKMACIDDFIMKLPHKYNTNIGENGVILSGGQKQRIAIARALLMKTEIILFDEATSALDNKTQKEISKAIDNLKGEYTILIVAHRLSTVIDCDRIYVVNDGKITDAGTHEELIKKSKYYVSLYKNEEC